MCEMTLEQSSTVKADDSSYWRSGYHKLQIFPSLLIFLSFSNSRVPPQPQCRFSTQPKTPATPHNMSPRGLLTRWPTQWRPDAVMVRTRKDFRLILCTRQAHLLSSSHSRPAVSLRSPGLQETQSQTRGVGLDFVSTEVAGKASPLPPFSNSAPVQGFHYFDAHNQIFEFIGLWINSFHNSSYLKCNSYPLSTWQCIHWMQKICSFEDQHKKQTGTSRLCRRTLFLL